MAINQISTSNTFGQWLTATQGLIDFANYYEGTSIEVLNSANSVYSIYSNTVNIYTYVVATNNSLVVANTSAWVARNDAITANTNAWTARSGAITANTNAWTATTIAIDARDFAIFANTNAWIARANAITANTNAWTARGDAITANTNAWLAQSSAATANTNAWTARNAAVTANTNAWTARNDAVTANTNAWIALNSISNNLTNYANGYGFVSKTSTYTLLANDVGRVVNTTGSIVNVPSNTFDPGNFIIVYNNTSGSLSINPTTSSIVYRDGFTANASRSVSSFTLATITCVAANTFVVSGSGVT